MTTSRTFFGHPIGLSTLFFTEMWERFSYYGMRALLVLFMTKATFVTNPGLGYDLATAGAIYGLYTSLVYILALPGGWIADNLWGQRKAIWVGGWIIAAGHFTMAVPSNVTFFLGLVFIICGTGLLKPNVSTIVGELYPEGGARRDAGFSIYYMGINLGAFLGPLITGYLGEGINWHYGFGAAGVGMILGLIQYRAGMKHIGNIGLLKTDDTPEQVAAKSRRFFAIVLSAVLAVTAVGYWAFFVLPDVCLPYSGPSVDTCRTMLVTGVLPMTLTKVASWLGTGVLLLVSLYFIYVWTAGGHTVEENKRMGVIFWLFLLIAVFWSGFEQAGTSLNLFARDSTNLSLFNGALEIQASQLQSVNALFIILLAPVFGSIWVWLEGRQKDPSLPMKAGLGLLGLAVGFFVIAWGAANSSPDNLVSPAWLVVTYFFHTVGELCISPIGLSAITKLSPERRVGQMMGIWFVGAALGNLFAGLMAGQLATMASAELFRTVAMISGVVGIFAIIVSPRVKRLMGGVK